MMEIHNLKMIVLYVEYDKTKYKDTLSILMNSLEKISCKKQVIVINNNNNSQSENKSDYDLLSGEPKLGVFKMATRLRLCKITI